MIRHLPQSVSDIEDTPQAPAGPSKLVELRDLDVNLGPNDTLSLVLTPEDLLEISPAVIRVILVDGQEEIEIDRSHVRWHSLRRREIAVPVSLDPAHAAPQDH